MVKLPKVGKGKKAKTMSNEDVVAKFCDRVSRCP